MDLENQKRVKDFADEYGAENLVVVLGAAEGEAAGLAAETVTAGDPTFASPLTGVQLGLTVYHVCEPEMKAEFDEAVYDENTTSAPAVFTHSAIAGPGIPSRSPIIIAFFPSKIAIIMLSPFFW